MGSTKCRCGPDARGASSSGLKACRIALVPRLGPPAPISRVVPVLLHPGRRLAHLRQRIAHGGGQVQTVVLAIQAARGFRDELSVRAAQFGAACSRSAWATPLAWTLSRTWFPVSMVGSLSVERAVPGSPALSGIGMVGSLLPMVKCARSGPETASCWQRLLRRVALRGAN